jgi:hypothetical protein
MVDRLAAILLASLLVVAGCKFSEELPAEPTAPFLVVNGVLNPRESRQFVTVERAGGAGGSVGISGATVEFTHLTPAGCPTPTVRLGELVTPQPGVPTNGIYLTRDLCPLRAGDRVALRVETPDGHRVTGTTRIPGASAATLRAGTTTAGAPPATIPVDRTRDSIRVQLTPLYARGMQVEAIRNDLGGFVTFRLSVDTMGMTIGGDLVDPFDGDNGRTVFRPGAYYLLTAAAMDTNYFDFVRSGSNPFTGRGFINHLEGGVGVFGSVAPFTYELKITAPRTDPREGIYRIRGQLSGINVDITWDIYRDPLSFQGDGFSGFVDGAWVEGAIRTSANIGFGESAVVDLGTPSPGNANAFVGQIFGPAMDAIFPGQVGNGYTLVGNRAERGTPFLLRVTYLRNNQTVTGTVNAVQISGP